MHRQPRHRARERAAVALRGLAPHRRRRVTVGDSGRRRLWRSTRARPATNGAGCERGVCHSKSLKSVITETKAAAEKKMTPEEELLIRLSGRQVWVFKRDRKSVV